MKILEISTYPPEKNGIAPYTHPIVQSSKKLFGAEFVIVANKLPKTKEYEEKDGEKIYRILDKDDFFYFKKIIEVIEKEKPDIVQIQHSYALFGKRFGVPLVPLMFYLRARQIPTYTVFHTLWMFEEMKKLGESKPKILAAKTVFYNLTKTIGSLSTRLIVLSEATRQRLIKDYGFDKSKIDIVHYGAEKQKVMSKLKAKKKLKLEGKYVLMCFGLPYRTKGFEYPIMAMKKILEKIPNAVMIITSSNVKDPKVKMFVSLPYVKMMKDVAKKYGVEDKIIFTDFIYRKDHPTYFGASDLVILPYLSVSGISSSLYCSLEYGSPVVVTDIDCFKEIEDGKTGLVVPSANADAIADAVIRFKENKAMQKRILKNIDKLVTQEWAWDTIARANMKALAK